MAFAPLAWVGSLAMGLEAEHVVGESVSFAASFDIDGLACDVSATHSSLALTCATRCIR